MHWKYVVICQNSYHNEEILGEALHASFVPSPLSLEMIHIFSSGTDLISLFVLFLMGQLLFNLIQKDFVF